MNIMNWVVAVAGAVILLSFAVMCIVVALLLIKELKEYKE